ncbi:MAG: dihydrodipicolinate synthase family protein [Hyphomicrobiaceae bacterium]|nr:dihydrodipicolinate synthase family protein [Hyphomicrobiaceae bacterium]
MIPFSGVGVIPACLLPLDASGEIDPEAYRRHLRDLAGIPRLGGIVINGHAAEVHALTFDQQVQMMEAGCEAAGNEAPIIVGIYAETALAAARLARAAEKAGASALLVFPPVSVMFGGKARPEHLSGYVKDLAAATDLPLIAFQFPAVTDLSYPLDVLVSLCEEVDGICAIKDLVGDPRLHEKTIEALHGLSRPVNVLTSHSQWLAGSIIMGARGIISGAGSVIADRQRALFEALAAPQIDRDAARKLIGNMSLLVEAFYARPYVDWQARMKRVLFDFGRFGSAGVLSPLHEIGDDDWERVRALIGQAGLDRESLYAG